MREPIAGLGVGAEKYGSDDRLAVVDIFSLGVERLTEALPIDDPEHIVNSAFSFSDLVSHGRNSSLRHLGRKQLGIMDSLTPPVPHA